jgi:hypothetical protein
MELVVGHRAGWIVQLVDGQDDGATRSTQEICDMLVYRVHSGPPIRDEHNGLGSLDSLDDLFSYLAVERSFGNVTDPSRIDQQEIPPRPLGLGKLPVARHSATLGDYGNATADNAIE